jgi:hypothetical protein
MQLLIASCPAADARGFVSFHFGVPLVFGPPVYLAPPPAYYVLPPPPTYTSTPPPPPPQQRPCHEYQTTAMIDGRPQPIVGSACLQADGTWRVGP